MLDFLQSFWWFLVLIGVMILLHELGHYLVARLFDVKIEAFSFGFGPRLFGFGRGETDFRVCAFPLGGYVKMTGEQPGEEGANDPRAFPSKPRWQRLLIIFAGPAVNVVLAVGLLTGLFMYEFPKVPNPKSPVLGYLTPDGAAAKAGMRAGDQIVAIDGEQNPTWEDIRLKEIAGAKRSMDVTVMRNGQQMHFAVTPAFNADQGGGTAGWAPETDVQVGGYCCDVDAAEKAGLKKGDTIVSMNGQRIRSANRLIDIVGASEGKPVTVVYDRGGQQHEATVTPMWSNYQGSEAWRIGASLQTPYEITQLPFGGALRESIRQNRQYGMLLYQFLQGIVERRMSPKSLDGPIGIARLSGEAAKEGPTAYLSLMAMVSLNLAVVNMLPIPLLDGGGILMLLIEMLMQRDMSLRVREKVAQLGLVFLMVVVVFVIYNDISKILPTGRSSPPVETQGN